ncbi:MAG TPA: SEC-C metal-binding domain-containing protein, partial [Thermodesulfovibrionales bacterium]|nr:SEC-C metal-binding domain-containing protein [Thermodesulfovibrionales bacterium]
MSRLGMDEDVPIENKMVSKAIENAQKKVEAHNFDIRKHLLEYDDIMNKQRSEIYSFRREILQGEDLKEKIFELIDDTVEEVLQIYCPEERHPEEWDMKGLKDAFYGVFSLSLNASPVGIDNLRESLSSQVKEAYEKKEADIGSETMRYLERVLFLQVLDTHWKDHLLAMDHLKEGIGLRGYGQRDPLTEYKKEAFDMFADMTARISMDTLSRIFKIQIREEESVKKQHTPRKQVQYNRGEGSGSLQPVAKGRKVGRNDPCPCGSGKKYKKCCGMNA